MSTCQRLTSSEFDDAVCVLPAGHAGACDLVNAMGLCTVTADCRATARQEAATPANPHPMNWAVYRTARENAIGHSHR